MEVLAVGMLFFGTCACIFMFVSVKRVAQIQTEIEDLLEEKENGKVSSSISEAEPHLQVSALWQGASGSEEGRTQNGLL